MSQTNYAIGGTYKIINGRIVRTNARPIPAKRSTTTGRFTSFKAALRALWFYTKVILALVASLTVSAFIGYAMHGNTITATNNLTITTPAPVAAAPSFPVLDRIARAESHSSQTCTKELAVIQMCHTYEIGSPLVRPNTNGSYDVGMYQINSIHLADARAKGFDVYTEAGNRAYAEYLFTTQGSEPWSASKKNW